MIRQALLQLPSQFIIVHTGISEIIGYTEQNHVAIVLELGRFEETSQEIGAILAPSFRV